MNNLIKYIIKNHKITDIKDDIIKILFIYNYRYNKKLKCGAKNFFPQLF